MAKTQSVKDSKNKKAIEPTSHQNLNQNKINIEEKTKNILSKINDNLKSVVSSINFNCKYNNDVENKINRISGEVDNLNGKINKG